MKSCSQLCTDNNKKEYANPMHVLESINREALVKHLVKYIKLNAVMRTILFTLMSCSM